MRLAPHAGPLRAWEDHQEKHHGREGAPKETVRRTASGPGEHERSGLRHPPKKEKGHAGRKGRSLPAQCSSLSLRVRKTPGRPPAQDLPPGWPYGQGRRPAPPGWPSPPPTPSEGRRLRVPASPWRTGPPAECPRWSEVPRNTMPDSLSGQGMGSQVQIKERERLSVKTNVISAGK